MSQNPRLTRARQLTSTVLPGRRPDDYPDQVTGRLRKLAAARSTGTLPFAGRSDGVVYFRDGKVAYAESNRTPGPAPHASPEPAQDLPPLSRIAAILAIQPGNGRHGGEDGRRRQHGRRRRHGH